MSDEKYRLRYNAFESTISDGLRDSRKDGDFFDVTLVCENGQLQAHKLVISACSQFFKKIFQLNPHPLPLLYFKDINISNLQSVIDFMYHGEVFISQDNLEPFLKVAQDLKVKGLTIPQDVFSPSLKSVSPELVLPSSPASKIRMTEKRTTHSGMKKEPMRVLQQIPEQSLNTEMNDNGEIAMEGYYYRKGHAKTEHQDVKTLRDLNQYIQSETGKSKDPAECQLCRKAFKRKDQVREHLAYKHFSYLFTSYTCQICGKNLSSKGSYAQHMKKKHP